MALNSFTATTSLATPLCRCHRYPHLSTFSCAPSPISILVFHPFVSTPIFNKPIKKKVEKVKAIMFSGSNSIAGDLCATAISGGVALSFLRLWEETAKRGLFDQVSCTFRCFCNILVF